MKALLGAIILGAGIFAASQYGAEPINPEASLERANAGLAAIFREMEGSCRPSPGFIGPVICRDGLVGWGR